MRLFIASLVLSGCTQTELSQPYNLDRIRLLGVRADVGEESDPILGTLAEARPGQTATFSALYYFPEDTDYGGAFWFGCVPEEELSAGCEVNESALSAFDDLDENSTTEEFFAAVEAAQDLGVLGFQPLYDPFWTIPEDALDGLSEAERIEGTNAFINVSLFSSQEDTGGFDADVFDGGMPDAGSLEVGFKRMPISEALTPNHNPDITDFIVAGEALDGANGFTARTGRTYIIEPVVPDGHTETYSFINRSDETVFRTEELYFQWYTEPGADKPEHFASFDQPLSLAPFSSVEWTAPPEPGLITVFAVVRDRRGGMGWRALKVNVL